MIDGCSSDRPMKFLGANVRWRSRQLTRAPRRYLAIALVFAWQAPLVSANDSRDTFSVRAGLLAWSADGSFASWNDGKRPVYVDLDTLGIDDADRNLFAAATWNIGERWSLRFDAFGFHNDGGRVANRDFEYDDTVVNVGASVEGKLDINIYMLNLGYRFIDRERWELGAGLGAHYVSLDYGFRARVITSGGIELAPLQEDSKEQFPVPNVYVWGGYRLSDQLLAIFDGGWLSANYGDYDGRIYFFRVALEYDFTDHFGVGGGYWKTDFDVDRETGTKNESYNVELPGPQIYLKARF
jgi:hypothetical protein